MIKNTFPKSLLTISTAALIVCMSSCKQGNKVEPFDEAFAPFISAYTTGTISRGAPIIVRMIEDVVSQTEVGNEVASSLLSFDPQIEGSGTWLDTRTVSFEPHELLPSGKFYDVEFALGEVLDVPTDVKTFSFQFETMQQSFSVEMQGVRAEASGSADVSLQGLVMTADVERAENITELVSASQGNTELDIVWQGDSDGKHHRFTVNNVRRGQSASTVSIQWNGKAIDVSEKGSTEVNIPASGEFVVMNVRVRGEPDPFVEVEFSDPLQTDQDLRGLITVSDVSSPTFMVRDNSVQIHFYRDATGDYVVKVLPGILNTAGKKLTKAGTYDITLEDVKPAVRLAGNGVIIPRSDGLVFPFEAVNLNAVDVTLIKIYEDNVLQFLQVNDLEGDYQIKRVGQPIHRETIRLNDEGPVVPNKWHRYGIRLDDMIDPDPGAIYRISIGFRRMHSLYACEDQGGDETEQMIAALGDDWDNIEEDESSYWDFYEDFYEDWNYDWRNRDNPCHDAYYSRRQFVSKNVVASDLGLIAKLGEDDRLHVTATDLLTAEAESAVKVEVYDYQQRSLASGTTSNDGTVSFDLSKKPFAIVATKNDQKGYVRLIDGNSLSLGRFDVSGVRSNEGVKGKLYGERGVWRPGDTLHLSFVLEDKQGSLPDRHPVTFELFDPRGQLVQKRVRTASVNGFYDFTTTTSVDAPTGDYRGKVTVGGSTFHKTLKIETVKPNRLKIGIDFGKEELSGGDDNIQANLDVKWLHGAVAQNLRTVVEMNLAPSSTSFPNYSEFTFDDPVKRYYSETFTVFDGNVDDEGQGSFPIDIDPQETAPGKLNAVIKTRAFEKGGNFSVDVMTIPYHPFSTYTGIKTPKGDRARGMLLTDTNHVVEVVTVTTDGRPVSSDSVAIDFYKLDWRWWWESNGNLSNYISRRYSTPLDQDTISTRSGRGKWTLRLDYPEWGRYLVRATDLSSGHSTGKIIYLDWPGWAGRGQRDMGEGAAMLSFNADKEKYNVGETVELMIPTSEGGRAFVSLESGYGVMKTFWADTKQGETRVTFKATAGMAPNVYAHVTLIQPHAQTANDLPIRMYGVLPIMVEDPKTHLEPVIATKDVFRPNEEVSITVSEKSGHEMAYTLAIVDEGLLDLTRFKTPDLWSHFYAKEALGVKTWDLFEQVLGAHGGELERLLAIGGDGEAGPVDPAQANRFKPVVQHFGPLVLKAGEKKTHTFTMPQYIGSVKVMLVAGDQGRYGSTEKAVPVRKPLMVLATMPRVIGPYETLKLPVNVFAMEEHVKNVSIDVSSSDLVQIEGTTKKTLRFSKPGEETVMFDLAVKPEVGIAKLTIRATSGSESASDVIEIDVRNPNPMVTNVTAEVLDAGTSWSTEYQPPGITGTNSGTLEVSVIPPLNLGRRLDYLIRYPHGCIEQTTSSVFPQLALHDMLDVSKEKKARMQQNIKKGIQRLMSFQQANGGLSYWPGGSGGTDDWSTSYAGHFMLEAKNRGYVVPENFMKKWKKYQKKLANEWEKGGSGDYGRSTEMVQAYRLYTLTLSGSPQMGAMNRLRETAGLSVAATWRLAAAYALAGQEAVAKRMITSLPRKVPQYKDYKWTYGTAERDEAMILETLTLLNERTIALTLVKSLSNALCEPRWLSTQTTAYCLLAIAKFSGSTTQGRSLKFEYRLNNGSWQSVNTQAAIKEIDIPVQSVTGGAVEVRNNGSTVAYTRVVMQGQPAVGDQLATESNLDMKVEYKTIDGGRIDPRSIEQGTDFVAEVTITHPGVLGTYDQMALSHVFASGWEITNTRMDGFSSISRGTTPEYEDIRDDRVYTYFDLRRNYSHTYKVALNASYLGRFYLPTVYCEAMYDASINARQPGMWVEVVPVGTYAVAQHGSPF